MAPGAEASTTAAAFDPRRHRERCEAYLGRVLEGPVRLVDAAPITTATRGGLWRLDVEAAGGARSFALRLESRRFEHEYAVLRAMEAVPIPTPGVYGWDAEGAALGVPCFVADFVAGDTLLQSMLDGESWAEDLYIETVGALQEVTREQLGAVAHRFDVTETAEFFLEAAAATFRAHPDPVADAALERLRGTTPEPPEPRFSNGDLWLENLIVHDRRLAGVVDFENAGFSDPLYEFLLPFFVAPQLRGRGVEERYCVRMGFDPDLLSWYRGLELFDTLHWVVETGEPFAGRTSGSLRADLVRWLETGKT